VRSPVTCVNTKLKDFPHPPFDPLTDWLLLTDFTGAGIHEASDSSTNVPQRFYRVRQIFP
jgi:hypothetical protein